MALVDYQKLCPKSGHVLSHDARDALRARRAAGTEVLAVECDACGRLIEVCAGPGQARSLIYRMHVRDIADLAPPPRRARR
jgi:YD repeat-containing protein